MLRIGKNPTNDLVIKDRAAEDFHCILYISNNELIVEDLKSHYGTLVNGIKISHAILYPGDELQIGFTRIEWQKLMPALQAIGDTSDAESFLQSQDLNLEIREDLEYQTSNDNFVPSDYTIDSTAELIEKAINADSIKELDYPVAKINIEVTDSEIIQSEIHSIDEETGLEAELFEPANPEIASYPDVISIAQKSTNKAFEVDPFKKYYYILGGMVALMIIAGVVIALVTG